MNFSSLSCEDSIGRQTAVFIVCCVRAFAIHTVNSPVTSDFSLLHLDITAVLYYVFQVV